MADVRNSGYAEFFEGFIGAVMEHRPVKIGVCLEMGNGTYITNYFGDVNNADIAEMIHHFQVDIITEITERICRKLLEENGEG